MPCQRETVLYANVPAVETLENVRTATFDIENKCTVTKSDTNIYVYG